MAVSGGVGKRKSKKSSGGFTKGPSKKSTVPGGGGRFENCVAENKDKDDPEGFCASLGRAKFGKKNFQKMSKKG